MVVKKRILIQYSKGTRTRKPNESVVQRHDGNGFVKRWAFSTKGEVKFGERNFSPARRTRRFLPTTKLRQRVTSGKYLRIIFNMPTVNVLHSKLSIKEYNKGEIFFFFVLFVLFNFQENLNTISGLRHY